MKNVFIIDTETTGLDESKDQVIEFAGIFYSVEHKTPISSVSFLLPVDENPQEKLNKISAGASKCSSILPTSYVNTLFSRADAVVAHNADFDKRFIAKMCFPEAMNKQWICTLNDVDWPIATKSGMSLVNLALSYGVPVTSAHRALVDCNLIAEIFNKEQNIEQLLTEAMEPKSIYVANVSFEQKDLAKNAGFIWDSIFPRCWARKMTEKQASKIDFSISKLDK